MRGEAARKGVAAWRESAARRHAQARRDGEMMRDALSTQRRRAQESICCYSRRWRCAAAPHGSARLRAEREWRAR